MARLPLTLLMLLAAFEEPGAEFYHDFRNESFPSTTFRAFGPEAANRIKPEREGLRMTLPAGQLPRANLGVATQFHASGDFEITVGYEIIRVDPPKAGRVGFYVNLQTNSPTKDSVSFFRMMLADGKDVYRSGRRKVSLQGKVENPTSDYIPAGGKSGQLRIVRTGGNVVLSAAEEPDSPLRELFRWDLGIEDIDLLSMGVNPLNSEGGTVVDVRVLDLRVRGKLAHLANAQFSAVENREDRGTWLWLVAGLVALSLVTGGVVVWWHQRGTHIERPTSTTDQHE